MLCGLAMTCGHQLACPLCSRHAASTAACRTDLPDEDRDVAAADPPELPADVCHLLIASAASTGPPVLVSTMPRAVICTGLCHYSSFRCILRLRLVTQNAVPLKRLLPRRPHPSARTAFPVARSRSSTSFGVVFGNCAGSRTKPLSPRATAGERPKSWAIFSHNVASVDAGRRSHLTAAQQNR